MHLARRLGNGYWVEVRGGFMIESGMFVIEVAGSKEADQSALW